MYAEGQHQFQTHRSNSRRRHGVAVGGSSSPHHQNLLEELSSQQARQQQQQTFLLGEQPANKKGKKTLVLDLDETLVRSTPEWVR